MEIVEIAKNLIKNSVRVSAAQTLVLNSHLKALEDVIYSIENNTAPRPQLQKQHDRHGKVMSG